MRTVRMTGTYKADMSEIDGVYSLISSSLAGSGAPESAARLLEMAADEIFSNIVNYGYGDSRDGGRIDVSSEVRDGVAEITFSDDGVPFDPLSKAPPDTGAGADERPIGGLGIYIVRNSVDAIDYSREDGHNILTLKKRIYDRLSG
ncbi:MAG: ATP-binding protein [Synergistaceae bacterium]|jgi:anti-sigma regulatory factor (Ser/Thr protein kinase)|nr:ATP-binding protein [Synergistaceae bacterium]